MIHSARQSNLPEQPGPGSDTRTEGFFDMTHDDLIGTLKAAAVDAGVFESVRTNNGMLVCEADGSDEPAEYRIVVEDGSVWVSLVTENRWLSESIESELMHTGDKLEELLEDEMVDLGYDGPTPTFEHFRSPEKLFTFRTSICPDSCDIDKATAEKARLTLLGYEACFRQLGDMSTTNQD